MATFVVKSLSDFVPPIHAREDEVEATSAEAAREQVKGRIVVSVRVKS